MGAFRHFTARQYRLTWAILLFALAVRLAIPAGFMPARVGGRTVITLCSGHGPMMMGGHHRQGGQDDGDKASTPCGFGALFLSATGGADPILLSDAIAYVLARLTVATVAPDLPLPTRLRPPLRAPPA